MKTTLNISKKINPQYKEVLIAIKDVAESLDIPFFIVGASARDFILESYYDIRPSRRTADIDIAVKVSNWDQFNKLYKALIDTKSCSATNQKQRLKYKTVFIDIVPFGQIANDERIISWPPKHEFIMSIMGFEDAFKCSLDLRINENPNIDIKIPSLAGLVIMKIISWNDKYPERKKDAEDILLIVNNYEYADNYDRLFDVELELLEHEDHDPSRASILLLGKDMKRIANKDTYESILKILDNEFTEDSKNRLTIDMMLSSDDFEKVLLKLSKLKAGFIME